MNTPQEMKVCATCQKSLDLGDFWKYGHGGKYVRPHCRSCMAAYYRRRYHEDPKRRAKQIVMSLNTSKRANGLRLPVSEAAQMILDAQACEYCGCPNDGSIGFAIDHRLPFKLGGENTLENVVVCCEPCNRAKHDMHPDDYLKWLEGVRERRPNVPLARDK